MLKGGLPKKLARDLAASNKRRSTALNRAGSGAAGPKGAKGAAAAGGSAEQDVDDLAATLLQGQGALTLPDRQAGGPFAQARRVLALACPKLLPCRDGEKARISKFIEDAIAKGEGWIWRVG
jgi:hypothetical protein